MFSFSMTSNTEIRSRLFACQTRQIPLTRPPRNSLNFTIVDPNYDIFLTREQLQPALTGLFREQDNVQ